MGARRRTPGDRRPGRSRRAIPIEALKTLIACPDLASKRWIWEQYDHMVMNDTVARPGGDAARGARPRHAQGPGHDHRLHAALLLWPIRTKAAARPSPKPSATCRRSAPQPLAITDNLNFGNPEKPEIMGQIVEAIQGMGEACRSLDFPVVSGNVSLYNETNGVAILPTPAIGGWVSSRT